MTSQHVNIITPELIMGLMLHKTCYIIFEILIVLVYVCVNLQQRCKLSYPPGLHGNHSSNSSRMSSGEDGGTLFVYHDLHAGNM